MVLIGFILVERFQNFENLIPSLIRYLFIFKLKKSERAKRDADRQSFFNRLAVVSASGCLSIVWHLVLLLGLSTKLRHLLYR